MGEIARSDLLVSSNRKNNIWSITTLVRLTQWQSWINRVIDFSKEKVLAEKNSPKLNN